MVCREILQRGCPIETPWRLLRVGTVGRPTSFPKIRAAAPSHALLHQVADIHLQRRPGARCR
jgi:hypothetical protein